MVEKSKGINWEDVEIPSHYVISVKDDPETGGKIVHADLSRFQRKIYEDCISILMKDAQNHAEASEKEDDCTFWMQAKEWIKQAKHYLNYLSNYEKS